jgi:hypothetical protein
MRCQQTLNDKEGRVTAGGFEPRRHRGFVKFSRQRAARKSLDH